MDDMVGGILGVSSKFQFSGGTISGQLALSNFHEFGVSLLLNPTATALLLPLKLLDVCSHEAPGVAMEENCDRGGVPKYVSLLW